jgi:hypothetical protein
LKTQKQEINRKQVQEQVLSSAPRRSISAPRRSLLKNGVFWFFHMRLGAATLRVAQAREYILAVLRFLRK